MKNNKRYLNTEIACEITPETAEMCRQILNRLETSRTINSGNDTTAYSEGYAAGWQEALLKVQAELANIAVESPANRNESRSENLVIMWSDVDKVINKMLEEING